MFRLSGETSVEEIISLRAFVLLLIKQMVIKVCELFKKYVHERIQARDGCSNSNKYFTGRTNNHYY